MRHPEVLAGDVVDVDAESERLVEGLARSTSETGTNSTSSFKSMVIDPSSLAAVYVIPPPGEGRPWGKC